MGKKAATKEVLVIWWEDMELQLVELTVTEPEANLLEMFSNVFVNGGWDEENDDGEKIQAIQQQITEFFYDSKYNFKFEKQELKPIKNKKFDLIVVTGFL